MRASTWSRQRTATRLSACSIEVEGFDVLFTDLQMPGKLDGIDAAVYARNRNPAMPVLVVSGVDAKRVISRLDVLGPPAVFINKPYSPKEIVETVRRLAQRR